MNKLGLEKKIIKIIKGCVCGNNCMIMKYSRMESILMFNRKLKFG